MYIMKKIIKFFMAICLVVAIFISCSNKDGASQFLQSEKPANEVAVSPEIAAIQTANALANYGYENESASALIQAALILAQTPTQPLDVVPEQINNTGASVNTTNNRDFSSEALLSDARRFAEGDSLMLAWADEVAEILTLSKTRGAVGGPLYAVGLLRPGASHRYEIKMEGGRWAEIVVIGDGDGDCDLYVFNERGRLIAFDEDFWDFCYVAWVPRFREVYTVIVKNNGRRASQYYIYTN
jgi:hypothetical protein